MPLDLDALFLTAGTTLRPATAQAALTPRQARALRRLLRALEVQDYARHACDDREARAMAEALAQLRALLAYAGVGD